MLRFKIKELISKKSFNENRRITIGEVAEETGVSRVTLSKMANQRGYNTVTDNLDKLCIYFDCEVSELVEFVQAEK
ncbi:DNA-binding transcriptional regulator, XRE family [Marinomonas fungiae]|uniref:DNA-binding transcriptional regulator, XRE family n=1 Tax=Marinomonas fungiae TaxID=1137284 RepID=A0A0K6ITN3_9GAMM|nr:helix-turn-helix domain-containing protein [Marinomonas fungiae]CUB06672.1 DNA-binding transcriptional regulator, XRE family [Marinomonas fungiae]